MSPPTPVSPPFGSMGTDRRHCYVETGRELWEASWPHKPGDRRAYPDFKNLLPSSEITLNALELSNEIVNIYKTSQLLGFGSDACVRLDGDAAHPVIKIAHPTAENRKRIKHEFGLMARLCNLDFVANTSDEPLMDENGVFGFRMEHLEGIAFDDLMTRRSDIETLLGKLHGAGFCHGDFSFSNIMQRKDGTLVLIDFGFAGLLGDTIPDDFPRYLYPDRCFTASIDQERIEHVFGWVLQRANDVAGR
ncbi:hypothetical protein Q7P37_006863 [Cladosporium fusiforme]